MSEGNWDDWEFQSRRTIMVSGSAADIGGGVSGDFQSRYMWLDGERAFVPCEIRASFTMLYQLTAIQ